MNSSLKGTTLMPPSSVSFLSLNRSSTERHPSNRLDFLKSMIMRLIISAFRFSGSSPMPR